MSREKKYDIRMPKGKLKNPKKLKCEWCGRTFRQRSSGHRRFCKQEHGNQFWAALRRQAVYEKLKRNKQSC